VPDNYATHEVLNQPEPLADYDLFAGNAACATRCASTRRSWTPRRCRRRAGAGAAAMQAHARLANVHAPQLRTHDRFGRASTRSSSIPATTR
jgi:putative acyl-CoA dehydrogenase